MQAYCGKLDSRIDGPIEVGDIPSPLHVKKDYKKTIELAKKGEFEEIDPEHLVRHFGNLKSIATHYSAGTTANDTRGVWIHGPPGIGKSRYVRELHKDVLYCKQ